nr:unnamed protein product [Callosobruchus chinensis]
MGWRHMVALTTLIAVVAIEGRPPGGGSYLGDVNVSAILDSFSASYDKRVRPNYGGMISGPPVVVGVTMYVLSISSLSEVKMARQWTSASPCTC